MATEIATLGEFGLIKQLTQNLEIKNSETKYGVGDDCAVLKYGELIMVGVYLLVLFALLLVIGYMRKLMQYLEARITAPFSRALPSDSGEQPSNVGLHELATHSMLVPPSVSRDSSLWR